jgi:hypothetical protein
VATVSFLNKLQQHHGFWVQSHKELCDGVVALATEVQSDQLLTNLIRRKFAIKCTTGALHPCRILQLETVIAMLS